MLRFSAIAKSAAANFACVRTLGPTASTAISFVFLKAGFASFRRRTPAAASLNSCSTINACTRHAFNLRKVSSKRRPTPQTFVAGVSL